MLDVYDFIIIFNINQVNE